MTSKEWTRRSMIQGLATMTIVWALPFAAPHEAEATGPDQPAPRDRETRRRWALARMDEIAQERLRCRERFKAPRQIQQCEAEFQRRYRAYNEVYLEASRE